MFLNWEKLELKKLIKMTFDCWCIAKKCLKAVNPMLVLKYANH